MFLSRHNKNTKQTSPAPESWVPKASPRAAQEGYADRLKRRQQQQHPKRSRGSRGPGPFKGPSHRQPGMNGDDWKRLMTGMQK